MKKHLLSGILALTSLFSPLKSQSQPVQSTLKTSGLENTEECDNRDIETVSINGTPFLLYTSSESEEEKKIDTKLQKILEGQQTSPLPVQSDLKELLEELKKDDSPSDEIVPSIPQKTEKVVLSAAEAKKELNDLLNMSPDPNKEKVGSVSVKPSEKQSDTPDLLVSSGISPKPMKLDISKIKHRKSSVADSATPTQNQQTNIVDLLASKGIYPTPMKLDMSKIKATEEESSVATSIPVTQKQPDTVVSVSPKPKKITVADQKEELNELLAATSSDSSEKINDFITKNSSEETSPQKENSPDSLPNSDDNTSVKIALGIWAALMGIGAAVQGKKYISDRKNTEYWPEEGPFPWNELAEKLSEKRKSKEKAPNNTEEGTFKTNDPLSPFSPIDLQNYLTETISPDLIQSVLKKKQEGVKLLPYYPIELDISPAKDPLLEKDRKILAQRLMALKSIGEIQKERSVLTRMMAKARRQDDKKVIAIITARREVLSEKIKKARLIVIGNQLDSIREQRHQLTRKITLAKRQHDHWQIDSVQKQRATLKTKEKAVKGFIRNFSYADYRRQWHTQRKQSLSRA